MTPGMALSVLCLIVDALLFRKGSPASARFVKWVFFSLCLGMGAVYLMADLPASLSGSPYQIGVYLMARLFVPMAVVGMLMPRAGAVWFFCSAAALTAGLLVYPPVASLSSYYMTEAGTTVLPLLAASIGFMRLARLNAEAFSRLDGVRPDREETGRIMAPERIPGRRMTGTLRTLGILGMAVALLYFVLSLAGALMLHHKGETQLFSTVRIFVALFTVPASLLAFTRPAASGLWFLGFGMFEIVLAFGKAPGALPLFLAFVVCALGITMAVALYSADQDHWL